MIAFWLLALLTVVFLHYQYNFGKEGETKKALAMAIGYTLIALYFLDNKLIFLVLMFVIVAMWSITVVSIFIS
ncbi:MAG: hypothetical protein ACI33P_02920 [Lysinibacillus sp.]